MYSFCVCRTVHAYTCPPPTEYTVLVANTHRRAEPRPPFLPSESRDAPSRHKARPPARPLITPPSGIYTSRSLSQNPARSEESAWPRLPRAPGSGLDPGGQTWGPGRVGSWPSDGEMARSFSRRHLHRPRRPVCFPPEIPLDDHFATALGNPVAPSQAAVNFVGCCYLPPYPDVTRRPFISGREQDHYSRPLPPPPSPSAPLPLSPRPNRHSITGA